MFIMKIAPATAILFFQLFDAVNLFDLVNLYL